MERARRVLSRHDPRKLRAGTIKTVTVTQRDLNLVANHLINLFSSGGARIESTPGWLTAQATLELPGNPVGRYLNVDVVLLETAALPQIKRLRIGQLQVPAWLADLALTYVVDYLGENERYHFATEVIKEVKVKEGEVLVTYEWMPDLADRLRSQFVSEHDEVRARVFHKRLVEVSLRLGKRVSLGDVVKMQRKRPTTSGCGSWRPWVAVTISSSYLDS